MGARVLSVSAAAVLAAAVAVYAALCGRERRLRREVVSERLMAGCTSRDVVALREQLEGFRARLGVEVGGVPSPRGPSAPASRPPESSPPAAPTPLSSSLSSFAAPVPSVPCPAVPSFCPSSPPTPVVSSSEGGPR